MKINIESCISRLGVTRDSYDRKYTLTELVENLKELRDRTAAGDLNALDEFFSLYIFRDGAAYKRAQTAPGEDTEHLSDNGWQPIETAPKTGVDVLLCRVFRSAHVSTGVGSWGRRIKVKSNNYLNGLISGDDDVWRTRDREKLFPDPTHWQPLPGAPKTE